MADEKKEGVVDWIKKVLDDYIYGTDTAKDRRDAHKARQETAPMWMDLPPGAERAGAAKYKEEK
jgi:hypothetical protein